MCTVRDAGRKVWTAAELEQMTPAEHDEVFESSVITDVDEVPAEFLGGTSRSPTYSGSWIGSRPASTLSLCCPRSP